MSFVLFLSNHMRAVHRYTSGKPLVMCENVSFCVAELVICGIDLDVWLLFR